jgi:hypothetical protein
MKTIIERAWHEPAVAIGLLVSVALAIGAVATSSDWSWETIVAVCAPLLSALGIRPLVSPVKDGGTSSPGVVSSPPGDAAV